MSFTGKRLLQAAPSGGLIGQVTLVSPEFPSSGTWTVPDGVYSISVLTIDAGQNGTQGGTGTASTPGQGGVGGSIGGVFYKNDIPVVPGQAIAYKAGIASTNIAVRISSFESSYGRGPGYTAIAPPGVAKAEDGGPGSSTTFQSGYGGRTTTGISVITPSSTAVSLTGTQNPGTTTPQGTGSAGRNCLNDFGGGGGGGGGGARLDGALGGAGGVGRRGCIHIVWPGDTRQFPDNV